MAAKPDRVRVRHGPSAGWVTVRKSDDWTHVIVGREVWTREEIEIAGSVPGRKRYVRPALHGKQLDLLT